MIGYIEGKLLKKSTDLILVLANGVGYEVMLPAFVMDGIRDKALGEEVAFFIFYQQTERQPKPVLIGFNLEDEKTFFEHFISVAAIGPVKAVKAMTIPTREIACLIENKDVRGLSQLNGIGRRTADKIIATLHGKVSRFALTDGSVAGRPDTVSDLPVARQVLDVLVAQLGHKPAEAKKLITEALKRNPDVSAPEELIDEIYRGGKLNA